MSRTLEALRTAANTACVTGNFSTARCFASAMRAASKAQSFDGMEIMNDKTIKAIESDIVQAGEHRYGITFITDEDESFTFTCSGIDGHLLDEESFISTIHGVQGMIGKTVHSLSHVDFLMDSDERRGAYTLTATDGTELNIVVVTKGPEKTVLRHNDFGCHFHAPLETDV